VLFLLWHMFMPMSERVELQISMGELVEFREQLPLSLLLDVQAGQTFQVYAAQIELIARLSGVRWLMYNHRIISFIIGTTLFWIAEMVWMGLTWLALAYCLGRGKQDPEEVTAVEDSSDARNHNHGTLVQRISEDERYFTAKDSKAPTGKDRTVKDEDKYDDDRVIVKEESVEGDMPSGKLGHGEIEEAEGSGTSFRKSKGTMRRRLSGEPSASSLE
jgi:seipin